MKIKSLFIKISLKKRAKTKLLNSTQQIKLLMNEIATAEPSMFRGVLDFFVRLGIYDVILPFLLVFTIMFAVLEKSKVFGTEEIDGKQITKKNLNAMVAFVIAFFVIASSKLVMIINEAMANIVILVLVSLSFLLLIGTFYKESEDVYLDGGWRKFFMTIMFIGVVLIFAHAIPYNGEPFLEFLWSYIISNYSSTAMSSIIMVVVLIGLMYFITKDNKTSDEQNKSKE